MAAAALACALAAVSMTRAMASAAGLLKVRLGGDGQATRIVMDLDQAASGKLVSDGADGHAVVILAGVSALGGLQGAGQGLVRSWRDRKSVV